MNLFKKSKSFIGVDIGTDSVKMLEMKSDQGKPTLVTYGVAESSIDVVRDTSPESTEQIVRVIQQVVQQARISSKAAIAALPTFAVFSSILSLPAMPKKDLAQAVKWEAKKFVPMPLDEMILDWKLLKSIDELQKERGVINQSPDDASAPPNSSTPDQSAQPGATTVVSSTAEQPAEGAMPHASGATDAVEQKSVPGNNQHLRVLITAAPKTLVSRYVDIFKSAGLQLSSLETEAFAVARSLIGRQRLTAMIVDIGSITTDIMIIEDGIPILNRSIDVGGKTLTTAIAQGLHINESRAEQLSVI